MMYGRIMHRNNLTAVAFRARDSTDAVFYDLHTRAIYMYIDGASCASNRSYLLACIKFDLAESSL